MYICIVIDYSNIPPEFIEANTTQFQKEYMIDKWVIYNYVDSKPNKTEAIRELSEEKNMTERAIRNIYYSIKD